MIRTPYPYYLIMHSHSIYRLDWLLEDSVAIIQQRKPGANLQEPDYTAAITTEFVRLANHHHALEHAKVGGSFIHQRPYVNFTLRRKKRRCELGDLLIICRKMVDGEQRFNAALMQLKMAHSRSYKTITDRKEKVQLYLYEHWPAFIAKGKTYDIVPKTVTLGAQYLFVNDGDFPLFTHSIPQQRMANSDYFSFGRFLYDFVRWQNGRPIVLEDDPHKDEWSSLIWDIVNYNNGIAFRRRNVRIDGEQRNNIQFLTHLIDNPIDDLPNEEQVVDNNEGSLACPILFIDLVDEE